MHFSGVCTATDTKGWRSGGVEVDTCKGVATNLVVLKRQTAVCIERLVKYASAVKRAERWIVD